MAMLSAGDIEAARKTAEHNIRILSELAREGHPIVCTEPAAALCLKQEYPLIIDHPDVRRMLMTMRATNEARRGLLFDTARALDTAERHPDETVWDAISGGAELIQLGDAEVNSRAYCSSFNFKGGDQQKKVGLLSGGERNRVHMARLL